jgi:tetratricopeptide (TPR) repeat protein
VHRPGAPNAGAGENRNNQQIDSRQEPEPTIPPMSCRPFSAFPRTALQTLLLAWIGLAASIQAAPHPGALESAAASAAETAPAGAPADPSPYARYEGSLGELERRLLADAADRRWDNHTLLAAALIAGGVEGQKQLEHCVSRFNALADEAAKLAAKQTDPEIRAQQIFDFMHRKILVGGYRLESTDLAATLDNGRFNCVSSTVLFNCLALRFGLEPVALELPGHAMTRLRLGGASLDVETTCPGWFQLRHDPRRQAALVAKTLGAGYSNSRAGREVSPVELIAMIYYNRGVDLLSEQRFAEAAAANAKALRLDPTSKTARGNLLATLNNWAITVGAKHQYEEAIRLLTQGLELDRHYETFTANYIHLHYQWADRLASGNDFDKALEILRQADAELLGADRLAQLRLDVYRRWARRLFQLGRSEQALQLLRAAELECQPAGEILRQVEVQTLADWAASLARQNRYSEAVSLLDWGLARQPDSELLNHRRRTALGGWTAEVSGVVQATAD